MNGVMNDARFWARTDEHTYRNLIFTPNSFWVVEMGVSSMWGVVSRHPTNRMQVHFICDHPAKTNQVAVYGIKYAEILDVI